MRISKRVRKIINDTKWDNHSTLTRGEAEGAIKGYRKGDPIPPGYLGTLIRINLIEPGPDLRCVLYTPPQNKRFVRRILVNEQTGKEFIHDFTQEVTVLGMTPHGIYTQDERGTVYVIETPKS